jgi:hypothetical protein
MYLDGYAHLYQKINGFKIKIKAPNNTELKGYLSLEPSTRSTYDIAMRDATINGLITMDDIEKLKPGQIFYKESVPDELFILQSMNKNEFQKNTKNINAVKQNCFVTVQRKQYNEDTNNEEYMDIYSDLVSFVSMQNKDSKNFAAGIEDTTNINIQIPKRDIEDKLYRIHNEDRIILKNLQKDLEKEVKVESIDDFGVPGVIRIYGTYDTRTGD